MKRFAAFLDRLLKPIYRFFGYVAACFLIAIGLLILTSTISRQMHVNISGVNEYAGFCMAAATFLALAYTFSNNQHIRVELFLGLAGPRGAYWLNVFGHAFASVLTLYATYYFSKLAQVSFILNEKSQGIDATPLWIPQLSLVIGFGLFSVSCLHHFIRLLAGPVEHADARKVRAASESFNARLEE